MRVAAVIPVYNGKRFIRGAVESVRAQSQPPAELVLVDDGSTDDSMSALEGLELTFPVSMLRQDNRGQSAARNHGVETTDCELVALLDQDDRWHPRHLERLTAPFARESALGWTYCNVDEIDEGGSRVRQRVLDSLKMRHPLGGVEQMVSANMHILPSAAVIRREAFVAVAGFDERLSGYEDDDLFLRLLRAGYRYEYIPESLTDWRIWDHSSAHSPRMQRSERIYAEKLIAEFREQPGNLVRDRVAPRFFANAMVSYRAAMAAGDWEGCSVALGDLQRYFGFTNRNRKMELRLKLMARPQWYAMMKKVVGLLPETVRSVLK